MDPVRPRCAKMFVYALGASACFLAASCTTSPDSAASFALTNPISAEDGPNSASSANAVAEAGTPADAEEAPGFPDQTAYLPDRKPGSSAVAADQVVAAEAAGQVLPAEPADKTPAAGASPPAVAAPANTSDQTLTAVPVAKSEQMLTAADPAASESAPKKRGFLSALFSSNQASASPAAMKTKQLAAAVPEDKEEILPEKKPAQMVKLASLDTAQKASLSDSVSGSWGSEALPGVRKSALFEIKRRSGVDDDSDVDLHEDDEYPAVRVASAGGMARLAPNGLLKQTDRVDANCLKPDLVKMLRQIEGHFGRKVVLTSGYRSPSYNRKVNGAKRSQHMFCAAADIQVPGVTKWELANFARALPGRGGVGTYCHTESVHVDIGPERDWNWRCRRRKA